MINQTPKLLVDIGEIGNASTGDILYEGGRKLNVDLDSLYNTFGDQRLYSVNNGENSQVLHATGYYQKATNIIEWNSTVALGSMRDVNTAEGVITARIAKGKAGEGVIFINSNGSLSTSLPLEVELQGTDSFLTAATNKMKFTQPYTKITLWCIDDANGVGTWDYKIESMFGNQSVLLDKTYNMSSVVRDIPLAFRADYKTIKLMLTAISTDETKYKASEILLYIDLKDRKVYSTEYAVIRRGQTNEEDEIYAIDFRIDNQDIIQAAISSPTAMKLAIKVISAQTIGVPV
ncbi:baseplate wedge tail fiber protein connector [Escherichia phage vB_EcoM_RZ]|uniref:Baseplate tail fiber connector n=1 Tax=Escherichia phage vB_EcoM_RZ TaxID=2893954 RepID=A0AAE9C8U7_9CAUD|nr:baseplate wedge tail fiber protein connector [Escherichia phage vB_EcoM_RZ]QQG31042.1 baseplate wedge subunit and tail fiber connector [Escherichia phage UPEC01]QWQ55970.1 baseplate wedge tail fiber connector [Escherichia phage P479]UGL60009.1 baseplate tail fiber connector [Escherichia phage vB_EcoM_RZ]